MADITLTVANAILKEDYLGPLRTAINSATPVLTRLVKNTRDIAGKEAWIPVEMELSQAAGARAENDTLPTPGTGTYQELKVPLKYYYGTMSVTGPAVRQTSKGERGSFGRIVDMESKGLRRTLSLTLAHDFYAGDNLGETLADAAVNIIRIDPAGTTFGLFNMEWLRKGMVVDILDAASAVLASARNVTAVDKVANTITVDGAALSPVVGGRVVLSNTTAKTVTSLDTIVAGGAVALHGVPVSTFDEWAAQVATGVGAFTVTALQQQIDATVVRSGKMPTALISDYTLQRKYFETLTANPRYMSGSALMKGDGGFRSLEYSGGGAPIPWIADRLTPSGTILGLHEPDLQVFTPGDFQFVEVGGDVWLPDIYGATGKDIYKAVLFRDMELGATNRNSHFKMQGVT